MVDHEGTTLEEFMRIYDALAPESRKRLLALMEELAAELHISSEAFPQHSPTGSGEERC